MKHPRGNSELFCDRSGADGLCVGGTVRRELQWRAKRDASNQLTARIDYEYWDADQALRRTPPSPVRSTGALALGFYLEISQS